MKTETKHFCVMFRRSPTDEWRECDALYSYDRAKAEAKLMLTRELAKGDGCEFAIAERTVSPWRIVADKE